MSHKIYQYKWRVIYAETDQMGVVYYANYFIWFEAARSEFLRAIHLPYRALEKQGIFLPVVEAFAKYLSPAYYEDEITVGLWIKEIKSVSLMIGYHIKREADNTLLATGYTRHTILDKKGKIRKIPEELKNRSKEYIYNKET
ncbi:MAG: acyl-CoA thioesterase [Spirochaetes bacterium]|nr:acyl-CoA thioesterase [Spirochaetota bacterium]